MLGNVQFSRILLPGKCLDPSVFLRFHPLLYLCHYFISALLLLKFYFVLEQSGLSFCYRSRKLPNPQLHGDFAFSISTGIDFEIASLVLDQYYQLIPIYQMLDRVSTCIALTYTQLFHAQTHVQLRNFMLNTNNITYSHLPIHIPTVHAE